LRAAARSLAARSTSITMNGGICDREDVLSAKSSFPLQQKRDAEALAAAVRFGAAFRIA
jgi:hypothetical protein